jgi:hypothetical protein
MSNNLKIVFEIEVDAEDLINEVGIDKAKELCIKQIPFSKVEDLLWDSLSTNISFAYLKTANIPVAFRKLGIK